MFSAKEWCKMQRRLNWNNCNYLDQCAGTVLCSSISPEAVWGRHLFHCCELTMCIYNAIFTVKLSKRVSPSRLHTLYFLFLYLKLFKIVDCVLWWFLDSVMRNRSVKHRTLWDQGKHTRSRFLSVTNVVYECTASDQFEVSVVFLDKLLWCKMTGFIPLN